LAEMFRTVKVKLRDNVDPLVKTAALYTQAYQLANRNVQGSYKPKSCRVWQLTRLKGLPKRNLTAHYKFQRAQARTAADVRKCA
jgi:hypothetical protein